MNRTPVLAAVLLSTLASLSYAAADTEVSESIRSAFYLYSQEAIHYEGITPGMTIGQQN